MLRSPATRMAARRFESTASQKAAEAARDTAAKAKEYQARAQEGLSRVTSAAGPALAGAAKGLTKSLGKLGGRTGRFIAFVESTLPPIQRERNLVSGSEKRREEGTANEF